MNEIVQADRPVEKMERPLDMVKVGQFWWVTFEADEEELGKKKTHKTLMCVESIGSNHVEFTIRTSDRCTSGARVHFDDFEKDCEYEPDAIAKLAQKAETIQVEMKKKMAALLEKGKSLCLITEESAKPAETTSLPVPATADPKVYKGQLVKFEKSLPTKTKEIEEMADELAVTYRNMALPQIVQMEKLKEALEVVSDKIFTVELYCGLLETVHLIKDGEPAPPDTKLTIRQLMLFMDEETLFDYKTGGMDFKKLEQFDEWVVKPENLNRILPEPKGIVAFRVRREDKYYGSSSSFLQNWINMLNNIENKKTYLLIRNGEKVYRIATDIDFSPRLIPLKGEIGQEQFTVYDEYYEKDDPWPFGHAKKRARVIGPDHLDFDKHVEKLDKLLKHYNRMIILIQGLLDRSKVFSPHPGISLVSSGGVANWINLVKDEEMALPNNSVTWEGWLEENNRDTKAGEWIYSNVHDEKKRPWGCLTRPKVIQVEKVRRDGSAVLVSWDWGTRHGYETKGYGGYYGKWGEWPVNKKQHQWIKKGDFVNLNHYHLGDYKTFLCDRYLKGRYLQWGHMLLTAEDWARKQIIEGKSVVEASKAQGKMGRRIKKTTVEIVEVEANEE